MAFAVGQFDFQIPCTDGQVQIFGKYQYLFTIPSCFSSGQVRFGATHQDGQIGVNFQIIGDSLESLSGCF